MLTTVDNPYDPFDQFNSWYDFDVLHHHNSCSILARIAKTSDRMTSQQYNNEIERAIDQIIEFDFEKKYKKVKKEIKQPLLYEA